MIPTHSIVPLIGFVLFRYFQPEEIADIVKALEKAPVKWKAMSYILIDTGCRRGELMGLQWNCHNILNDHFCICITQIKFLNDFINHGISFIRCRYIGRNNPTANPTGFFGCFILPQKVRKTPDFLSKSGVFMVAEAGLEPTTSGL